MASTAVMINAQPQVGTSRNAANAAFGAIMTSSAVCKPDLYGDAISRLSTLTLPVLRHAARAHVKIAWQPSLHYTRNSMACFAVLHPGAEPAGPQGAP